MKSRKSIEPLILFMLLRISRVCFNDTIYTTNASRGPERSSSLWKTQPCNRAHILTLIHRLLPLSYEYGVYGRGQRFKSLDVVINVPKTQKLCRSEYLALSSMLRKKAYRVPFVIELKSPLLSFRSILCSVIGEVMSATQLSKKRIIENIHDSFIIFAIIMIQ